MLPNAAGNWIEERILSLCCEKKKKNAVAVMMLLMIVQNRDNSTHNVQLQSMKM